MTFKEHYFARLPVNGNLIRQRRSAARAQFFAKLQIALFFADCSEISG